MFTPGSRAKTSDKYWAEPAGGREVIVEDPYFATARAIALVRPLDEYGDPHNYRYTIPVSMLIPLEV